MKWQINCNFTQEFSYLKLRMNIEQLIGELLLRNYCVVIPKFGGFISGRMTVVLPHGALFRKNGISNLITKGLIVSRGPKLSKVYVKPIPASALRSENAFL